MKFPKQYRGIKEEDFKRELERATEFILEKTDSSKWDKYQLFYVAKAVALYKLMTDHMPEITPHEHYVELRGIMGTVNVLYKPIKYAGAFTRGYRYVKIDMEKGKYVIVKIKKKKVKKKENKEV